MSYDTRALAKRIKAIPAKHWERLADLAGCPPWLPRKVAYEGDPKDGEPRNFGLNTVGPLIEVFAKADAGQITLPADDATQEAA